MKISVIVPVYNSENYIIRCIDSIISQSYKNWELILIDDGSTDSSYQLIINKSLEDERIKVIHQENSGPGIARNTGIDAATGDYIVFVDSDDFIDTNYLRKLAKRNEDVVFIDVNQVDEELNLIKTEYMSKHKGISKEDLLKSQMTGKIEWGGVRKAVKTALLREHNIRYSEHKIGEEAIFSFCALYFAKSYAFLSGAVYSYVNRDGSQSDYKTDDPWGPVAMAIKAHINEMKIEHKYGSTVNAFLITSIVVSLDRLARQYTLKEYMKKAKAITRKYKNEIDFKKGIDYRHMDRKVQFMYPFIICNIFIPVYFASKINTFLKACC